MKKLLFFGVIASIMMLASCTKDDGYNRNYPITPSNTNLTFWMATNCGANPVTVTIDSQTKQISQYYPNGTPTCNASGCANFYLAPGAYHYVAIATDTVGQGTITVPAAGCLTKQLQCATGNLTFWADSAADNTRVTINNQSAHMSVSFPTSTPTCGTTGCANFTLPTGTYTYTAITNANIGYTGSVTVLKDSCVLMKLF